MSFFERVRLSKGDYIQKTIVKKKSIQKNIKYLKQKLNISNLVIKRGSKGSMALMDNKFYYSKPFKKNNDIIDTAGAGDYYLSMFASTEGLNIIDRLKFSNIWAYLKLFKITQVYQLIKALKKLLISK